MHGSSSSSTVSASLVSEYNRTGPVMTDLFKLISDGCSTRQFYLVLQSGCNVNSRNAREETPLMSCITHVSDDRKRVTMIRLLLQAGADVNKVNKRGQTALMYACILDQADTIIMLLNTRDVDVNHCDIDANTALMYACSLGNVMAVKVLFKYHSVGDIHLDFNARNYEDATALEYALSSHHSEIVSMFAEARIPSYTKPVEVNQHGAEPHAEGEKKEIKDLFVEPELLKARKTTPEEHAQAEESPEKRTRIHSGRKHGKDPMNRRIPKITVSRTMSDEECVSDDLDVEGFGNLVKAMRECAAEMRELHSNIENKDNPLNTRHEKKGSRRQKTKQRSHESSFETTTLTLSTTKLKTSQLSTDSETGNTRERRSSTRTSHSTSFTQSQHFNSFTSLKSSDGSKETLVRCSNDRKTVNNAGPLLSISAVNQLSPRGLCQVSPSTSKSRTKLSMSLSDHVNAGRGPIGLRGVTGSRNQEARKDLTPSPCASSLSDRSAHLLSPSQVTLQTSAQGNLSLESSSPQGSSKDDRKPVSRIFKDPWNFSSESLPQLPKFGQSKNSIHLPPLRETLRGAVRGAQQRVTTLKTIDKELWKLLETSKAKE